MIRFKTYAMRVDKFVFCKHIFRRGNNESSVFDQIIGTFASRKSDLTGYCKHVSALAYCMARSYQRTAFYISLNNNTSRRKTADDSVSDREMVSPRLGSRRIFGKHRTASENGIVKFSVILGIHHVNSTAENSNSLTARADSTAESHSVTAERHTADDDRASCGKPVADGIGITPSRVAHSPRSHNRYAKVSVEFGQLAHNIQDKRSIPERGKSAGIILVSGNDYPLTEAYCTFEYSLSFIHALVREYLLRLSDLTLAHGLGADILQVIRACGIYRRCITESIYQLYSNDRALTCVFRKPYPIYPVVSHNNLIKSLTILRIPKVSPMPQRKR